MCFSLNTQLNHKEIHKIEKKNDLTVEYVLYVVNKESKN